MDIRFFKDVNLRPININFSLCPTNHNTMKMYEGVRQGSTSSQSKLWTDMSDNCQLVTLSTLHMRYSPQPSPEGKVL